MNKAARPRVLVHATSLALLDAAIPFGGPIEGAVLLLGDSGAGKSDVALRLIAAGAKLIADDQSELFIERDRMFVQAPATLKEKMEIRGVGIMRVPSAAPSPVIMAVQLETAAGITRLPEPAVYRAPQALQTDVTAPLIMLNAFEASTPAKIAAAAAGLVNGTFVAGAFSGSPGSFL